MTKRVLFSLTEHNGLSERSARVLCFSCLMYFRFTRARLVHQESKWRGNPILARRARALLLARLRRNTRAPSDGKKMEKKVNVYSEHTFRKVIGGFRNFTKIRQPVFN